ncbi:hypothetical protein BpHYR1_050148 [Brachionus plicatilis]|uniref:Uncharacterized protein n=1 Tax=Brachionus plicatilis TaxID=10195 RepID=A0A3M7QY60_BRAPC|nr:hypothetical protein BpHYR1_050148 [Brachionus plicatilis]
MSSIRVDTHFSAACSTLMAHLPMARTDLRTKSTSTSVAYSFSSPNTWAMLEELVNRIIMSKFPVLEKIF